MELSDIITRVQECVDQTETDSIKFYPLFQEFCRADGTKQTLCGVKVWAEMWKNRFVPEDLSSDDDANLASMLIGIGEMLNKPEPIEYAFILMHHRLMLGDYLEKAFISKLFLYCLKEHQELVDIIIHRFIEAGDVFYAEVMDPEDIEEEEPLLYYELMRALLPPLCWMKERYPQVGGLDQLLSEDYLQFMSEYEAAREGCKPALPKLSALCRFLNETVLLKK